MQTPHRNAQPRFVPSVAYLYVQQTHTWNLDLVVDALRCFISHLRGWRTEEASWMKVNHL